MKITIENGKMVWLIENEKDREYLDNLCGTCGLSPCDCKGTCDGCGRTNAECNQDDAC